MHPLRLKSHKSIGNIAVRLLLPVLIWRQVANRETFFNEMHYEQSDHCMQLCSLNTLYRAGSRWIIEKIQVWFSVIVIKIIPQIHIQKLRIGVIFYIQKVSKDHTKRALLLNNSN